MRIKEITIQKSRTIDVQGIMGRDHYRKITIGMTAEISADEIAEDAVAVLSEKVNEAINNEILNIKAAKS